MTRTKSKLTAVALGTVLFAQPFLPNVHDKLIVDLFAGGGGASSGIEARAQTNAPRVEELWLNPAIVDRHQPELFGGAG